METDRILGAILETLSTDQGEWRRDGSRVDRGRGDRAGRLALAVGRAHNQRAMKLCMVVLGATLAGACSPWPGVGDQGFSAGASRIADTSGNIGSECGSSVTCVYGLTCLKNFPSGMCTKTCASTADCSKGSCQLINAALLCLPTCFTDQMCREGYVCVPNGDVSVCVPGTRADAGKADAS